MQVLDREQKRYLVYDAGRGAQSVYTPGEQYSGTPYDIFGMLPYMSHGETNHRSVLLLGLGGGNMIKLYKEVMEPEFTFDITAVEIDSTVVEVAKKYFDTNADDFITVVDDARHYLRLDDQRYDIIIVDAYTHETQIPTMLATTEFFQLISQHLNPDGVLGINAMAFTESRYLPKFLSTIAHVFPDVRETTFTPTSLNHFIVAGQAVDTSRIPPSMNEFTEPFRASALAYFRKVESSTDIYTDDRTDLDIRVRPFLD